jgi:ubiquitin
MYKAYIRGVPDIGQIDEEDIANEGIESIIKKKEQRLLQMKLELTKAKDDVNSKRALLQVDQNNSASSLRF